MRFLQKSLYLYGKPKMTVMKTASRVRSIFSGMVSQVPQSGSEIPLVRGELLE